jgi:hypothetical protein
MDHSTKLGVMVVLAVASCADSGVVDDASIQRSLVHLQRLGAAMTGADGRAGALAVGNFHAALGDILTPEAAADVTFDLSDHDLVTGDVLVCEATACTFDYSGFHGLYYGDSFTGDVTRDDDRLTFDVAISSSFRMQSSSSSTLAGTLIITPTDVDGTVHVTASDMTYAGQDTRSTKRTVDVTFHHVALVPDGCSTSGHLVVHASKQEDGDTTYDLEASPDVGASCF